MSNEENQPPDAEKGHSTSLVIDQPKEQLIISYLTNQFKEKLILA